MNARGIFSVIVLGVAVSAAAASTLNLSLATGDSQQAVLAEMGRPEGRIAMGDREVWFYPAGEVVFENGIVAELLLLTPERAKELEKVTEERRARETARRERLTETGVRIRDRMRESPEFLSKSGTEQLRFWEAFRTQYPEVEIAEELGLARALSVRERADAARVAEARRLVELEDRLARLEEEPRMRADDYPIRERRVIYSRPFIGPFPRKHDRGRRGFSLTPIEETRFPIPDLPGGAVGPRPLPGGPLHNPH